MKITNKNGISRGQLLLIFIIALVFLFRGNIFKPQKQQALTYNVGEQMVAAKASEEAVVEKSRMENRVAFDKHFANGRYFERYDDLEEVLNLDFKNDLYMKLGMTDESNYFLIVKNEYFKSSLKLLKEGKISKADILRNPFDHVFSLNVHMIFGQNEDRRKDVEYNPNDGIQFRFDKIMLDYRKSGVFRFNSSYIKSDYELRNKQQLEFVKTQEDPVAYIMNRLEARIDENGKSYSEVEQYVYHNAGASYGSFKLRNELADMGKMYNINFIWAGFTAHEDARLGDALISPVNHPDIKVSVYYPESKLTSAIAQKAMYEEVDKIIDEEGYAGKIAHMTTPKELGGVAESDLDRVEYDLSKPIDNLTFIQSVYTGDYDTVLNVLLTEGEEIDYVKLKKITARINGLTETPNCYVRPDQSSRSNTLIYFYNVDEKMRKTIVALFKRDWLTANYFKRQRSLSNMMEDMVTERADTDGFIFLELYGEKYDIKITRYNNSKEIIDMPLENFKIPDEF